MKKIVFVTTSKRVLWIGIWLIAIFINRIVFLGLEYFDVFEYTKSVAILKHGIDAAFLIPIVFGIVKLDKKGYFNMMYDTYITERILARRRLKNVEIANIKHLQEIIPMKKLFFMDYLTVAVSFDIEEYPKIARSISESNLPIKIQVNDLGISTHIHESVEGVEGPAMIFSLPPASLSKKELRIVTSDKNSVVVDNPYFISKEVLLSGSIKWQPQGYPSEKMILIEEIRDLHLSAGIVYKFDILVNGRVKDTLRGHVDEKTKNSIVIPLSGTTIEAKGKVEIRANWHNPTRITLPPPENLLEWRKSMK